MTAADPPPPPAVPAASPPRRRRRPRAKHVSLGVLALLVVAFVGGLAFMLSPAGLPFVIGRVIEQSGGRLTVEGGTGSLASTMRFRRLAWTGPESTVTATDVVVEWSPWALVSKRLAIRGLGAGQVTIAVKPSSGATAPPESLVIPLGVDIANAAVAELLWQAGPRHGRITGLEFGYAGDADVHRVSGLRLVSDFGALRGDATLGAAAPFPLSGTVAIVGDGPLAGAKLDTRLGGTLAAIVLDAKGTLREATLEAHAALAPFAGSAFENAKLSLGGVDLERFRDTLPATRLTLDLDVRPTGGGFGGTFSATNALSGPIDDKRLPLTSAAGRFTYSAERLELADVAAEIAGGGRATGSGTIELSAANAPSRWRLAVRDLDLARISKSLVATKLTGTLSADVDGGRQSFTGDLAQASMAVSFAASYADRRLDVSRLRAEAMGGVVTGSGRITLDAPRAFDVALALQRFDPARFGAWPAGSLDGTVKASGVLLPEWRTTAAVDIARGSRLAGVALTGTARGTATRRTLADASVDVTAGTAHLVASGGAGALGDKLLFTLAAPRLADLAPLLPARAAALSGALRAEGTLRIEPGGIGGNVDAHGTAVSFGTAFAAQEIGLAATVAPGGAASATVPVEARRLKLTLDATKLRAGDVTLATANAAVEGTLAHHTANLAATGPALDAVAVLDGGLASGADVTAPASLHWTGRIASLANRGDVPFVLAAPATLELATTHVRVAGASIAIADGHADLGELLYDNGRVSSRGAFDGVPASSIARLAGRPLPLATTLTLSGNWAIAASPRLSGTLAIRRERGDVFGVQAGAAPTPDLAFGIDALQLTGTFVDDALDARVDFNSARAGRAHGTLSLGALPSAPPGRLSRNAPLKFALDAELLSLTPLQPWLGTTAVVNGQVHIAISGRGTLDAPVLAGTIAGDGLRVDAPPYGIALRDGRVRAHLADGGLAIDEISIMGGEGKFTASGTVAARREGADAPRTRIAWHAENFRATNRPELRLVVDGSGTLAVVDKRLDLSGDVKIVDGHIEYERTPPGQLGPDVVVVGRPRKPDRDDSIGDLPLRLDVNVDLGNRLSFSGAGLETALAGRVRVTTSAAGRLMGQGSIVASNGTYFAFGQKLTIERGRLIFDGPLDNPALDVVALRKNLTVEAGVELSGTAKVPRVRVTSNPPVPENEALAWLITGEGLQAGSRSDYAALSAASSALLSNGGKPLTQQIAQTIGLDDITVRGGGLGGTNPASGTAGQVIVFGKRITDKLTLGYQQGLSIATNALRIEYALSNTLTLRAEAGTISGLGIFYRRSFE